MQVGVEIGGTFTDLVWLRNDGTVVTGKVPSTPKQVEQAVLDAVRSVDIPLAEVKRFTHGSTVATNALLTRSGAKTGLLTTEGFRDIIEIGTHDRTGNIYTAFYEKPRAPIARRLVREVRERVDASGRVLTPLDEEHAWREVEGLLADGVTSIAICLLHGYRAPEHERALRDLIRRRAPQIEVFTSHEVSPEFREYERTVTTVVNAFVGPVVKGYVDRLEASLQDGRYGGALRLMQSNGGIMPAAAAGSNAVKMLLSGPAAGVRAAIWFARRNGMSDILTLDMGGTSTDVAIAPGLDARIVPELVVDGLPIRTTAMDMATVGAGGGSIASIDAGGYLNVGPASAGAVPGPACYDRGGTLPTVTDAQVIAGLLRPERFFGGKMALRTDLAGAALSGLKLGGTAEATADAVLQMVNSNMAAAVRLVSTARGIDPRDYTLVAFGGGGPLHGAMVADEVGMRRILVPWSPGIASAFGLLVADLIVDVVASKMELLSDASLDAASIAELKDMCGAEAKRLDLAPGTYEIQAGLDLRYAGQGFELTLWRDMQPASASEIDAAFQDEHKRRYGYARPALKTQMVNLRARIIQRNGARLETPIPEASGAREHKEILLGGKRWEAAFLPRSALGRGETIAGPAILEEATSTSFVPPGWTCTCLASGDLLLEKAE
ncbi:MULTISPECIES: hydantoinase/oxoprolinase family protein [unclassified Chelatococcus]|uniref:hydantoinase/oxoprolinase family protein n=1 Tax=unclassified Chelatococcus TaxID=2638111 RepID=UPI001BCC5211|nr:MULTISPECIES: hydantoinase/oxoprolinase family protein [unclassified Chelatococcus]MBS7700681.1 hydantoinase/oxoprolinase family protein [Chelatococcus sp. YT9]MBX3559112.1 hydantoinase/oxoprolinase family protein [Chelatococcus sp.]